MLFLLTLCIILDFIVILVCVQLLVTNTDGCTDSITQQHEVHVLPLADFIIGPNDTICAHDPFTFTDNSTTNVVDWQWDFGDGNIGSGASVTHSYSTAGDYIVTLFVENDNSCLDTVFYPIRVDTVPIGDFTSQPIDTCCVNELANFYGTSTCNIVSWQWDFDDGSPIQSGQNVTHAFTNAGTYNVSLTIQNQFGCDSTITYQRTVEDISIDFSIYPSPSCLSNTVNFNGIGNVTFTDWNWDFGDGGTAIGHDVTHVYTSYDTFDVTLTVCTEQVTYQHIVLQPAEANAGSDENICERDTLDLSLSSTLPSAS